MELLGAGLYGAGRSMVANFISPATNMLPLGNVKDEAGMFGVDLLAASYGHKVPVVGPILKHAGKAGMLVEVARVGEAIATGQLGMGSGSMSAGSGNYTIR